MRYQLPFDCEEMLRQISKAEMKGALPYLSGRADRPLMAKLLSSDYIEPMIDNGIAGWRITPLGQVVLQNS